MWATDYTADLNIQQVGVDVHILQSERVHSLQLFKCSNCLLHICMKITYCTVWVKCSMMSLNTRLNALFPPPLFGIKLEHTCQKTNAYKVYEKRQTKVQTLAQIIWCIHPGNGQTKMLHKNNLLGIFSNMAIKGDDYHLNLMYSMYLRTQVKCKPPKCQVQHKGCFVNGFVSNPPHICVLLKSWPAEHWPRMLWKAVATWATR